MAYFIVIGTNNDVECVVDEIKNSHLQHNVVTSGCVRSEGNVKYYHWDVFNEQGHRINENDDPIALHDALTNQIAHFKTLLPDNVVPNVFIVSRSFDADESETLHMVYEELCQIGGATLGGLQVDVVLVGYDLSKPEDVTQRPHWRVLESLRGLGVPNRFHTNILYLNNMDYMGAATNVDAELLGRFLCHWSKMVSSGGHDPKTTVNSKVYSIGLSEYQYDFRVLNDFFELSAEERLLDRTLNNAPSSATQTLLNYNYYKKIDLSLPWLDGLCAIQDAWGQYCSTPWDPTKRVADNPYSVSRQEQEIASYLNLFLGMYIAQELRAITGLNAAIAQLQSEQSTLAESMSQAGEDADPAELIEIQGRIFQIQEEINELQTRIKMHRENIADNTYSDADAFHTDFGTSERITEEEELRYASNYARVGNLIEYLKSGEGINILRKAVERATVEDVLPQPYPAMALANMGRAVPQELSPGQIPALPVSNQSNPEELAENPGCLAWFVGLFKRRSEADAAFGAQSSETTFPISEEARVFLNEAINRSVSELKRVEDIREWWRALCRLVEKHKARRAECILKMDGEKNLNGDYLAGRAGYSLKFHRKSVSLIEMDKVRVFREGDSYYKKMISKFLDRWFDSTVPESSRMTMPQLIKHQVLDPLVGRFHTLKWDGSNPFVTEEISDKQMHEYIEHCIRHSKPFVEYVRLQDTNINSNLNVAFYSNNPNIPVESNVFRNRYEVSLESINPVFQKDFVNSLCVVQVLDIPQHIDSLKDFKPRRDAELSRLRSDITSVITSFIGNADTVEAKAEAIYKWICDNIVYDTTMQIFDVETCWRTRRGVCRAYCELFCYMAESVGLTADIVTGITKNQGGEVSEEKHAWIFVYTSAYDGLLIDPTWGAGSVFDGKFVKNEDNSMWFNVSPYWMFFSHYPDQQYWTKLDIDITENQFRALPYHLPSKDSDGKDVLFDALANL